jgi:light-regulated signal transduction histidine kinase (bacteriophytochrome)
MDAERLRFFAVYPLEAQGQVIGGIAVFSRDEQRPDPSRLLALEALTPQVALAVQNAQLLEEIRSQAKTLKTRVDLRTWELQASNQELEAFSYSVSHDLRAPLRAIQGFSSILKEDHADQLNGDACQLIDTVQRNAQRMSQLINDLLAFSRLGRQPFECKDIDMQELVKQALDELSPMLKDRSVDIQVGDLPAIQGDRALLLQVWLNLLGNALKYTAKRDQASVAVDAQTDANEVVYRVRDNGAGFDMKYADRLFKVFQRLHSLEEFEGTGAGLAIVQRVIHRHGGRVGAEGQVDAGATFWFSLPLQPAGIEP